MLHRIYVILVNAKWLPHSWRMKLLDARWWRIQHIDPNIKKAWRFVSKIWTPILVDEGTMMPRWYGCGRYIPQEQRNPPRNPKTFRWQFYAYPIPVNVVLSAYYAVKYFLRRGCRLPPKFYTNKYFNVFTICPDCGRDLYAFPGREQTIETPLAQHCRKLTKMLEETCAPEALRAVLGDDYPFSNARRN